MDVTSIRPLPEQEITSPSFTTELPFASLQFTLHAFIHSFITRFPIRRSGALQQTFYGSPPTCPVLGFLPPCV